MLRIEKLKKVKGNFPVLVGSNIIPKSICKILIEEISNSKSFDDMIMGGRSRINKGSKNFNNYINNQKSLKNFLNFLIVNLSTRKLKIYSKKDLKIDHGKTQIYQRFLIQKNLLSKKN